MGLTNKREEQIRKMPLIEARLSKSKDGKYLIHRTIITYVRPMSYYKAIVENAAQDLQVEDIGELSGQAIA